LLLFSEKTKENIMLNKYFAIGYLGGDPELRYGQSGTAFTSFSLAIDDSYKDRDDQKVKRTIWLRCTAFGKTAENLSQLLSKGSRVQVEGSLTLNEWTDREGNERKDLQLRLQNFTMLDKRERDQSENDSNSRSTSASGGNRSQASSNPAGRRNLEDDYGPAFPSEGSGMDDVPF
jgi:single-strand DNA-binding protein